MGERFGKPSSLSSIESDSSCHFGRHRPHANARYQIAGPSHLPANFFAIWVTWRPWDRAIASSFSLGTRFPSPPASVPAPYGEPPVISAIFSRRASLYGTPTITMPAQSETSHSFAGAARLQLLHSTCNSCIAYIATTAFLLPSSFG